MRNGQKRIDIGFQLDTKDTRKFLRQMKICWNATLASPVYVNYAVSKAVLGGTRGKRQIQEFIQDDDIYGENITLNEKYKRENQQNLFLELVGTKSYVNTSRKSNNFLSKGHLAARSDFAYDIEGLATFRYVNTAPQWQSINGGNWVAVEGSTQIYADSNQVDLQVFTGTYGEMQLPHEKTQRLTKIFFYVDKKNKESKVPVPAWFWKIVYEPQSRRGVFVITSNNPYVVIDEYSDLCTKRNHMDPYPSWIVLKYYNATEKGRTHICRLRDSLETLRSKGMIAFDLADNGVLGQ